MQDSYLKSGHIGGSIGGRMDHTEPPQDVDVINQGSLKACQHRTMACLGDLQQNTYTLQDLLYKLAGSNSAGIKAPGGSASGPEKEPDHALFLAHAIEQRLAQEIVGQRNIIEQIHKLLG